MLMSLFVSFGRHQGDFARVVVTKVLVPLMLFINTFFIAL